MVTIYTYFTVSQKNLGDFKTRGKLLVSETEKEPGCLHYFFSFAGGEPHSNEGYRDADAFLAHIKHVGSPHGNVNPLDENVSSLYGYVLEISQITRREIHGPKSDVKKLRRLLNLPDTRFFVVEFEFRR